MPRESARSTILGTLAPNGTGKVLEEEIAFNRSGCWSTYRDVFIPADAAMLQSATVSSIAQAASSSTVYKVASFKSEYIDPVSITITSLASNLGWGVNSPYNQYTYAPLNAIVVPYSFNYAIDHTIRDDYSTYGPFKWSGYSHAELDASADWHNNSFETILLAAAAGNPLLTAAVLAACAGDNTAVFNMDAHQLVGAANGTFSYNSTDQKSGGCTDLVHRDAQGQYGSQS